MTRIEIPPRLAALLRGSPLEAPIGLLVDRVSVILADNKLPFFPDYTDHGINHVNDVLRSEVELVPKAVWDRSTADADPRLLNDVDAAVIVGATLLHDIAMHLRPAGFLELVSDATRFKPLPWFREQQEEHATDRAWPDLWKDYVLEARRFSDRALGEIIGHDAVREDRKFHALTAAVGDWTENHRLVVGEFIRRHHARLAHEVAIYGFPGLRVGYGGDAFPAIGEREHSLKDLADLIGLTARSHGMSLRVCKAYLDEHYERDLRPMGSAVLFPMALLRVADYLQIDHQRAPAVLLQLREPQSPVSVREWKKHRAVRKIGESTDPRARMVTVSKDVSLELFLQLRDLLDGLQGELDHSTAVLDEAYGARADLGLNHLGLSIRRVHSNLTSPAFMDSLSFVPERTGFSADPHLLTLLVKPLYGDYPGVGVRELMQNSVDAVRELHAWCEAHKTDVASLSLPDQEDDVLIDFIQETKGGRWVLCVSDKGIGMTADTIQNYFLRAGASFRQSAAWSEEFRAADGRSRVARSGRFGVGAFATFLLGSRFTLWTRHVTSKEGDGFVVSVSQESSLVEITRTSGLRLGSRIEVDLAPRVSKLLKLEDGSVDGYQQVNQATDWFCWEWPSVTRRVVTSEGSLRLRPSDSFDLGRSVAPDGWFEIQPKRCSKVYWSTAHGPKFVCNGLRIAGPGVSEAEPQLDYWPQGIHLRRPGMLGIVDQDEELPLNVQRFGFSHDDLGFVGDLCRDVTMSYLGHALVNGPQALGIPSRGDTWPRTHPLASPVAIASDYYRRWRRREGIAWCVAASGMVPVDPWLFGVLGVSRCVLFGSILERSTVDPSNLAPRRVDIDSEATINWTLVHSTQENARRSILALPSFFAGIVDRDLLRSRTVIVARVDAILPLKIHPLSTTSRTRRPWGVAEIENGTIDPSPVSEKLLTSALKRIAQKDDIEALEFFVVEIDLATKAQQPDSIMASVWSETIGAVPIPFDQKGRLALIERGRQHPELRRHIEYWEKEKRRAATAEADEGARTSSTEDE
jgi:molecular chaperone HtpG